MNICFIACFNKTIFFKKISDEILKALPDSSIFWISTSPLWTKYLELNGTPKENITRIYKTDKISSELSNQATEIIKLSEKENNKSANFTIQLDRVARHWKQTETERYINNCAEKIHSTIKSRKIDIFFGEATALHEVLTSFICKAYKIPFLKPHTIRIPSNRFSFFKGHLEEEVVPRRRINISELSKIAEETIRKTTKENTKPNYFYDNNKTPSYFDKTFIKKLIRKIPQTLSEQKHNGSEKSIFHHLFIEKKAFIPIRATLLKIAPPFEIPPPKEKYVLFTLHKQPEASIDVLCTEHSDQIELIRKISLNIPREYKIYVKEHSNAIGERPLGFLQKIKKIPNVRLISPYLDSHQLIKDSELVITISGTIAFEASLFEKKSVTFSPIFFNAFSSCHHLKDPSEIHKVLTQEYREHGTTRATLEEILKNSHEGLISDPISLPECIDPENIRKVTAAFVECISAIKEESIANNL